MGARCATWLLVGLGLGVGALAACGTSRVVERTATGGIIELSGLQYQARSDADDKMSEQCDGVYTVVAENGSRVRFVCGAVPGLPASTFAPPAYPTTLVPNSSSIGLR